jgi:tRNA(Ile)-lysidine synthase
MIFMIQAISLYIQHHCQLSISDTVLVGVSGGPDSLCLMDVLHQLGYPLIIAHLNHGLRAESDEEARRVERFAQDLGLAFVSTKVDVKHYADRHALSIEEAARVLRYQFLFDQAERHQVQAVAVGHTADDQIETVVMHLLRGCGLAGLKGMVPRTLPNAWSQRIPLVRPLLATWREQVLAYCSGRGLQPVYDRSNLDTTYFRNRLRHELIPYLETFNPAARKVLWRMAQVLAGDAAVLDQVVTDAWNICRAMEGDGLVALSMDKFNRQPLGIQRHLLRRAIAHLRPGLRNIDFDDIERAIGFLSQPSTTKQIDLVAGLRLSLEEGLICLASWEADLPTAHWPQMSREDLLHLDVPGEVTLNAGWSLRAEPIEEASSVLAQALENTDPLRAWIAADDLPTPLLVRTRLPGDRFRPLGMAGHTLKLADLMVNLKIPQRARDRWPLVCTAQEIVWLPGYRLNHLFRLTTHTRRAVYLRLERHQSAS